MLFDITSFVLGAMTGGIVMAAIALPRVGRILTRFVAVVLSAVGVGLLTWATVALVRGSELTPIVWEPVNIVLPGEAYGWGGSLLLGGALALVFSFMGRSD